MSADGAASMSTWRTKRKRDEVYTAERRVCRQCRAVLRVESIGMSGADDDEEDDGRATVGCRVDGLTDRSMDCVRGCARRLVSHCGASSSFRRLFCGLALYSRRMAWIAGGRVDPSSYTIGGL